MYFINRIRLWLTSIFLALIQPLLIFPVIFRIPNNRSSKWRHLRIKCKGICFLQVLACVGLNSILVRFTMFDVGEESFPYSRLIPTWKQLVLVFLPGVKVSDDR